MMHQVSVKAVDVDSKSILLSNEESLGDILEFGNDILGIEDDEGILPDVEEDLGEKVIRRRVRHCTAK